MNIKTRAKDAKSETDTKTADTLDVQDSQVVVQEPSETVNVEPTQSVAIEGLDRTITGRGVFAVRTVGDAVSVETGFLEATGNVLRMPAIFPNREYALAQIDELRQLVDQHFDELKSNKTLE